MKISANMAVVTVCSIMMSMLTACGGGKPGMGSVAIIDLDAIAVATGKSREIRDAIAEMAKQREDQLTKLQGEMVAKVDAEKDKLGKKPSKEQQQNLRDMVNKARQDLRQGIAIAKQETQKYRVKLINDFKQEILPVAIKVATQKNFSVVMIKNQTLFYATSDTDITQAVIVELNKSAK